MKFLLAFLPVFILPLVSCTFTSSCFLQEPADIKSFETETLKYFNSAQQILSCGKRFKSSTKNLDSKYEKCVFALDIHQNYKTGLFSFTSKYFVTEYDFKEAIEVGAFNFCNTFVNLPSPVSVPKTVRVSGGNGFDFNLKVKDNSGAGQKSEDAKPEKSSDIKTAKYKTYSVHVKPKTEPNVETKSSDFKYYLAIGFGGFIILCIVTYLIVSAVKRLLPDQKENGHVIQNPYNYNRSSFSGAPPSYEEVNRPFHSYSVDKSNITKDISFEKC